jgi:hypothetical protein
LNTELERRLGKIVKDKYGTDFYILHRYPMAVSVCYFLVRCDCDMCHSSRKENSTDFHILRRPMAVSLCTIRV